jgi:hypothetical protein
MTATLQSMIKESFPECIRALPMLCQGKIGSLRGWLELPTGARLTACAGAMVCGCACYGFTLGFWRSPEMGVYVALKLPFLIALTLMTNGLINGMLAQVLGSGLTFRQTLMAMLMSFATFSMIAGALSPIAFLFVGSAPGPQEANAGDAHSRILLTHTIIIAFTGITAFRRFLPVLRVVAATRQAANLVFTAWLAGNLFVGAQLSWNLRPFFGQPGRPVELLRPDWNQSSFYESILVHLRTFTEGD